MLFKRRCMKLAAGLAGLAVLGGLAVSAHAARQAPRPAPGQSGDDLVAAGDAPDLALLFTGGVAGYVEPCG
ncbi:MAG: hypothetical protein ACE5HU_10550 [Acidobacteriota bacterium]